MDRDALMNSLPANDQFLAFEPWRKKETVEKLMGAILDGLEAEKREPDAWEAHDLLAAIGALTGRMYGAALTYAAHCLASPEERYKRSWPRAHETPTVAQLRKALEYVAGMPAPAA